MDYRALAAWVDGAVVAEATISVRNRGLLYGDGCFECLRLRGGLLLRPYDHPTRGGTCG